MLYFLLYSFIKIMHVQIGQDFEATKPCFIVGSPWASCKETCLKWRSWLLGKLRPALRPPHLCAVSEITFIQRKTSLSKVKQNTALSEVFVKCES